MKSSFKKSVNIHFPINPIAIWLLVFSSLLSACNITPETQPCECDRMLPNQELGEARKHIFLWSFEQAVRDKDTAKIISMIKPSYLKNQHDELYRGHTKRFINDLFCGYNLSKETYRCIALDDIQLIQLSPDIQDQKVGFYINDSNDRNNDILAEFGITKATDGTYYLYSSVG